MSTLMAEMARHIEAFIAYNPETFTVSRVPENPLTFDAHGNPEDGEMNVLSGEGAVVDITAADLTLAEAQGERLDMVLVTRPLDIRVGDTVVCSRGTYTVIAVARKAHHQRNLLRQTK
jgi:hypothetical protein